MEACTSRDPKLPGALRHLQICRLLTKPPRSAGISARPRKKIAMDSGLEGVIAAETVLSHSDGERGILWVRGHSLPELVAELGYDGAVALLWEGFAGEGLDRARVRAELGAAREAAFARRGDWLSAAADRPFIEGVRLALAALPEDSTPAAILGSLPVAIA